MSKRKLYMLMGISGSGKTTLREKIKKKEKNICVISFDDVRKDMLDFKNTGKAYDWRVEPEVQEIVFNKFKDCIKSDMNIIMDATNVRKKIRQPYIDGAKEKDMEVIIELLLIDPRLAEYRNNKRIEDGKIRSVTKDVINKQYHALIDKNEQPSKDDYDKMIITNVRPSKNEKKILGI